eukprot:4410850-Amphidinium_carterae.1
MELHQSSMLRLITRHAVSRAHTPSTPRAVWITRHGQAMKAFIYKSSVASRAQVVRADNTLHSVISVSCTWGPVEVPSKASS